MSNILSYSTKTTKAGQQDWIAVEPYTDDDIAQIKDPDGALSENPRTAIPSPFAQLDLVKNAFRQLANSSLTGGRMNERLVSNALDVAQLLFDFENHRDRLHLVRWNRTEQIARLKSSARHRLYGETLELFLTSDRTYNFDMADDWFVLLCDHRVLGGTSPASVVMAAPAVEAFDDIKVEQGVSLFSTVRHLWQRDDDFIYYMYLLFNAFPSLREHAGEVYAYMTCNIEPLRRNKPATYERIIAVVPNLNALDRDHAAVVRQQLEVSFDPFGEGMDVGVLGARFYHKRVVDALQAAAQSDFVIDPDLPQPGDRPLPLVLRTGFNGAVENFQYIDKPWDSATVVLAGGKPLDDRLLPDTALRYPFLTTDDLLADTLVRLDGGCVVDSDHFFDGNVKARSSAGAGYLIPLKPAALTYFSTDYLRGTVAGRHVIDIEEQPDGSVLVTLRVRVRKSGSYIELSRRYLTVNDPQWRFDEQRGTGRVIAATMSASLFPMVRTAGHNDYTVQLFDMVEDGRVDLAFYGQGLSQQGLAVTHKQRSRQGFNTVYYDVDGAFDVVVATVHHRLGTVPGLVLPVWQPCHASARELVFAVDFGTTNTHVEWAERGHDSQPVTVDYRQTATLTATLHREGTLAYAEQVMRVEFVPRQLDEIYGFPMRSALARNSDGAPGHRLFGDVNIPFLYERRYFSGYDVTTNLKWMGDTTLAREFLRELVLLIRAKTLLEQCDPDRIRVVYFYPVSMSGSDRRQLQDTWEELFTTYLSTRLDHLQAYPESVAPAAYYSSAQVAGDSFVSVDIGGGTTDTVIYQPTADRLRSEPVAIASFRFAGNAVFGDAFAPRDADNNPLLQHYTQYFDQLIGSEGSGNIAYLRSILHDIAAQKRSEDINAFLFSVENVEELRTLRPVDRNLYSYNALLRNDDHRKPVFIYFYSAIIYYLAQAMAARGYEMPKQVYFSGTGSKILGIVGRLEQVTELTQRIFEGVYGQSCKQPMVVKVETECPKQMTCRGGIRLENRRLDGEVEASAYSPRHIAALKHCHSMLDNGEQLTLAQVTDPATRAALVEQVRQFNTFFLNLCDKTMCDEMGLDKAVMAMFEQVVGDNLDNYLTAGINSFLQGRYESGDIVEDVPFFYPIIGAIRHNLLTHLCHEVLSRAR